MPLLTHTQTQTESTDSWNTLWPPCWKFTPTLTGEQGSSLASHFHPGEITAIAIWRINSVTYGNSKIHLLCWLCLNWERELLSCPFTHAKFILDNYLKACAQKKDKKGELMTKPFRLDRDNKDQTFDQEPNWVSVTAWCTDKSVCSGCDGEASKLWPFSQTLGAFLIWLHWLLCSRSKLQWTELTKK